MSLNYDSDGVSVFYNNDIPHPDDADLFIPRLRKGSLSDLSLSGKPAISLQDHYYFGIREFLRVDNVYVFDNHNHAFFAWCEAFNEGLIGKGSVLVHVDLHADNYVPDERVVDVCSLLSVHDYTLHLDVNDFIAPAFVNGLVFRMLHVHPFDSGVGEDQYGFFPYVNAGIDTSPILELLVGAVPKDKLIVDIDLDYFMPFLIHPDLLLELRYRESVDSLLSEDMDIIKELISLAGVVTIATSPGFICQQKALDYAVMLLES